MAPTSATTSAIATLLDLGGLDALETVDSTVMILRKPATNYGAVAMTLITAPVVETMHALPSSVISTWALVLPSVPVAQSSTLPSFSNFPAEPVCLLVVSFGKRARKSE